MKRRLHPITQFTMALFGNSCYLYLQAPQPLPPSALPGVLIGAVVCQPEDISQNHGHEIPYSLSLTIGPLSPQVALFLSPSCARDHQQLPATLNDYALQFWMTLFSIVDGFVLGLRPVPSWLRMTCLLIRDVLVLDVRSVGYQSRMTLLSALGDWWSWPAASLLHLIIHPTPSLLCFRQDRPRPLSVL